MSDKPISIAHIVLTMEAGGLESVVNDLCIKTDKAKFQPKVICLLRYDQKYKERLAEKGVSLVLIKKKYKYDFGFFFRVANYLRRNQVKVIHVHSGCFFYGAIFSVLTGFTAMVFTAHGLPILNRVQDKVEDNLASFFCKKIVSVSDEIANVMKTRLPFAKHKVVKLINGVDTERFYPVENNNQKLALKKRFNLPEDKVLIGTVGRLAPEKNYQMLLGAFAICSQKCCETQMHLVFIGDGPLREGLQVLRDKLNLEDHVTFLGEQYAIHSILPMIDIFALSSSTEGTSISLLEAQSCGIPAVVTDVGGNSQVIAHEDTGFLCVLNDELMMADFFLLLASDSQRLNSMGVLARRRVVENFSLTKIVELYTEIYQKSL
jgi:glycosyltransferase involved in cell wall biosynthesis